MSEELTTLPLVHLARLIRRREVSPVEVAEAYLRRVERLNPRLNAIVTLAPDALEQARAAESRLMRGEKGVPLLGLPLTVKDTIETRGLRTTFGSKLRAGFVPERDAGAVARLRAAGAVILGKTNAAELALEYTASNHVFGRTNNPFDVERTPGGSSGGCAAAVASCLTAASLGSDLAGSIRIPAHFCGVAGLKPTSGSVPATGHLPPITGPHALAASLGPLARRVEDLELLYSVLAGANAPHASDIDGAGEEERLGSLVRSRMSARRFAWYAQGACVVDADTKRAVDAAVSALEGAGLTGIEEKAPGIERGAELWMSLFSYPTQKFLREFYSGHEGTAGAVAALLIKRGAESPPPSLDAYLEAWAERDRLRAELLEWMKDKPFIIAPVGATAAMRHGTRRAFVDGHELSTWQAFGDAQVFNVFDLPAACVPVGRTAEGLPIGVQIVGRPREEALVLAAARVIEASLGSWRPPPVADETLLP